jgi:pyridoxamine 5'-phosphate oxidase family protein
MRIIAVAFAFAVVIVLGYVAYLALTNGTGPRQAALESGAKWRVRHYGDKGARVVAVSLLSGSGRVLDEHVVDRIPDSDPTWEERFLRARQTAEERAFHLNAARLDED